MPDNVQKENIPEEVVSPVNLGNIEKGISAVNDNLNFFIDEYKVYKESIEKENSEVESSEVVGFEELVSSIGLLNESVDNMNNNIIHVNTSISFFIGIIIGLSVVSYIWKGVLKNVF